MFNRINAPYFADFVSLLVAKLRGCLLLPTKRISGSAAAKSAQGQKATDTMVAERERIGKAVSQPTKSVAR